MDGNPRDFSRRTFLRLGSAALGTLAGLNGVKAMGVEAQGITGNEELMRKLRTPHKFPELVLKASYEKGDFDALAVDCPFVFRHKRRFYMTYVGFDGTGYRTGLASSGDLMKWEKEGIILDRGNKGSVTEFNAAMSWIIRDNDLLGEGRIRNVPRLPAPGIRRGFRMHRRLLRRRLQEDESQGPMHTRLRSGRGRLGTRRFVQILSGRT